MALYQSIHPTLLVRGERKSWRYSTPNRETWIRAKQMLTKEPQTIDWLNSLERGQSFWDIGANIGTFSLYAASVRNATVSAFEPISSTYALLVENILVNQLCAEISPYCLAFSDHTGIGTWYVEDSDAGSTDQRIISSANIDEIPCQYEVGSTDHRIESSTNINEVPYQYDTKLNILCYTIDDFIKHCSLDVPSHIKIDVDGGESNILRGAQGLLRKEILRSILVEVDEADVSSTEEIVDVLYNSGFHLETKTPVKGGTIIKSHRNRWHATFNYVFWRR